MPINDMDNSKNPMAGLMSLLQGGAAGGPPLPPQQTAMPMAGAQSVPQQAAPASPAMQPPAQQGGGGMNPMIQSLMGQAQQTMNNPMGQPVPQGGGLIDALQHPLVAGIIKALAGAAQSYGWTAMMPQERVERTQMQQQKAEALSRLGLGGAEYEGSLAVRQQLADTNQQKANTLEERAKTAEEMAGVQKQRADAYDRAVDARSALDKLKGTQGQQRIDVQLAQLAEKADDFTRKLDQDKDLAKQNIGIKSLHQQTYQGYVNMLGQIRTTALQQNNTKIAEQAQQKLAEIQSKSWVQDLFGMAGPSTAAGAAQAVGAPQALPQAPVVQQPSTTGPSPKAKAKGATGGLKGAWNPVTGSYE